jgi:hypothetical protein
MEPTTTSIFNESLDLSPPTKVKSYISSGPHYNWETGEFE